MTMMRVTFLHTFIAISADRKKAPAVASMMGSHRTVHFP
jgi:hypothetical protein